MPLSISPQRARAVALVGLLLAAPALYFVPANVLRYNLGLFPGGEIAPLPPLLLAGGAALALLLNAAVLLRGQARRDGPDLLLTVRVRPLAWNLLVVAAGAVLLAAMFAYVFVENIIAG